MCIRPASPPARFSIRGMSFAEVLVVLAVLGVLVYFLIVSISGVVHHSAETTAKENLNVLNAAVLRYNQSVRELVSEAGDERDIFGELQKRDAVRPVPGSPFLSPHLVFVASGDEDTFRAKWNGRMFEMLGPGTPGNGLDLNRMLENSAPASEPPGD